MTWSEAFLTQARSDLGVFDLLNRNAVAYSHRLHYFQMAAEKAAKSLLADARKNSPPPYSHVALISMLRMIKGQPLIRHQLGYNDTRTFSAYVDSLLDVAHSVERLASAVAGSESPNSEYPWHNRITGTIIAPALFDFPEFNTKKNQLQKLINLIRKLISIT